MPPARYAPNWRSGARVSSLRRVLLAALLGVGLTMSIPAQAYAPEQKPIRLQPKQYAKQLVIKKWGKSSEWKCLAILWGKESAWDYRKKSITHDYGIPQRHMKHNTPAQIAEFLRHPYPQIEWGVGYIAHRYNTPCSALDSWLSRADKKGRGGWY